jgi:hypothetical protein
MSRIFLPKPEIWAIKILIGGIYPRLAGRRAGNGGARLFETLLTTTERASREGGNSFLFFSAVTH